MLSDKSNLENIDKSLKDEGITWKFIPSYSPHMGGLWEAGIKSVKGHIKRVVGNSHLDFEQLYTLLVQIEAILNSRPLCPISSEPDECDPLTPSHFLIGRRLTSLPNEDLLEISNNKLNTYQHVQKMAQHIWKRWSKEYVSELQTRTKWKQQHQVSIKPGALVLLREDGTPPLKWSLARIVDVHPGADNVIRAVSVRLPSGHVVQRAVSRMCVLEHV